MQIQLCPNAGVPLLGLLRVLICRAQSKGTAGSSLTSTKMSFHDEPPPSQCLSYLTVLSQQTLVAKCLSEEIRLPLFMAVSFIRSQGSWSHRGAVWKQQHARPERRQRRFLCEGGTICIWLRLTERGFTASAKWKSHTTYRQLCQATSGLSDLTVNRVLAFETALVLLIRWGRLGEGHVVLFWKSCANYQGLLFFLFATRFSASATSLFLWHLWVNCKTFI